MKISTLNGEIPSKKFNYDKRCHKSTIFSNTKNYYQAPLPFQGQKRKWNREFKTALKQFDDCNLFVDLFGGSGLLSRMVKNERPDAVVFYNDFDDYHKRIANIPLSILSTVRSKKRYEHL